MINYMFDIIYILGLLVVYTAGVMACLGIAGAIITTILVGISKLNEIGVDND